MTMTTMNKGATLSECGLYRYSLYRKWGPGSICTFIMLNPSTADAVEDDPTIRRCIAFAKREGCDGILVENLFAFRATKPMALTTAADPVGRQNDARIRDALRMAAKHDWPVIAAWGANKLARERGAEIARWYDDLKCLGKTKSGAPRHPLYVPSNQPLEIYP